MVLSGNKPSFWPDQYRHIMSLGHHELTAAPLLGTIRKKSQNLALIILGTSNQWVTCNREKMLFYFCRLFLVLAMAWFILPTSNTRMQLNTMLLIATLEPLMRWDVSLLFFGAIVQTTDVFFFFFQLDCHFYSTLIHFETRTKWPLFFR